MKPRTAAQAILSWARKNGRHPPWREGSDAYRLAVAEVLLQKTRAEDVQPVWAQLIRRYPTEKHLAKARKGEIAPIVGSIGLKRQRTDRLKKMAVAMSRQGADVGRLPGIGSYGSSLLRLARGLKLDAAPVDGNIARVLARYCGLHFVRGEPRKKPEVKRAVMDLLAARRRNQDRLLLLYGLVDLGALVCRPTKPACSTCPLFAGCSYALETSKKVRIARARL